MNLRSEDIALELEKGRSDPDDPLIIAPEPSLDELRKSGSASVDLRLGCWLLFLRQARLPCLTIADDKSQEAAAHKLSRYHYVRFGDSFYLHPRSFVLGCTLEWVRLPRHFTAIVTGKSSWGRRGLVIATATGVHPGFTGCLTLEITNLGEIPIELHPGMPICQLFIHELRGPSKYGDQSNFAGQRRPVPGLVRTDDFSRLLSPQKD